ncbi:asparagine synthase-related protein [Streptomyces sp. LX-29]|uniref:asparagine synthase-related protein n=1 Tax=Streptomyces sp. LX-29 TaxID=2900152 RepID=UPI00240E1297|nr:asparagine synthase-related protein [Streptomyces sp. LX-29]WFB05936.1 asparagine synthase-related protein [Streptomyces sp. LX-29]
MDDTVRPWFVVLPDRDAPADLLTRLRRHACRTLLHPSGRPWLSGCWPDERMVLGSAGRTRVAVAGTTALTAPELDARVKAARTAADVESAVRDVPGSFHVIASLDGAAYLRGTATGTRRIFWATVDGVPLAADRARTLAWLSGAEVDTAQLAARLAVPCLPHPLSGGAMWRGVRALAPGDALHLERDGGRTATWWRPPPAELPLSHGAVALRAALRDAVRARVRPGQMIGADLSGGLDSSALCFLAAEAGARLVTVTLAWSGPGNQDVDYARYAAERLPGVESLVFPSADLPPYFSGLRERRDAADEPWAGLCERAQQHRLTEALRDHGARHLRLSGHGGDHVLEPPTPYVHALLRRRPWLALRHVAGYRAGNRWPLGATARMLIDGRPYDRWLAAAGGRLRQSAEHWSLPEEWGILPRLPAWASEQAVDSVAGLLRSASARARPLAGDRGRHAWAYQAQEAGRIARLLQDGTAAVGLPVESPFCDDAVVAACLSVQPHQARDPWSYKRLLGVALDGLVPERLLRRTTKDHCNEEWHHGLRVHRRDLARWADDSRLVAAGVVDPDRLRRLLHSPGLLEGNGADVDSTLCAEAWLRDLAAHPTPAYLDPSHREEHSVEPTAR